MYAKGCANGCGWLCNNVAERKQCFSPRISVDGVRLSSSACGAVPPEVFGARSGGILDLFAALFLGHLALEHKRQLRGIIACMCQTLQVLHFLSAQAVHVLDMLSCVLHHSLLIRLMGYKLYSVINRCICLCSPLPAADSSMQGSTGAISLAARIARTLT